MPGFNSSKNITFNVRGSLSVRQLRYHSRFIPIQDSSLQWRHNGRDSVSNHQPHHCLLNRLFKRRPKKTSKLRVTGLCAGNSPGTGEFPAQIANNAENVSIWWRHHVRLGYRNVITSIISYEISLLFIQSLTSKAVLLILHWIWKVGNFEVHAWIITCHCFF